MFKIVGTVLMISLLCTDRDWEVLDAIRTGWATRVLLVDMQTQGSCDAYNPPVKEDFSGGNYRYEVSLPEYSHGNFNVTIKYRVMMILGHEPRPKFCHHIYYTVTTLPEHVDTKRATWSFDYGTLEVLIPGKPDVQEVNEFAHFGCYSNLDLTEIHVPKTVPVQN